jgi:hypothetical protein
MRAKRKVFKVASPSFCDVARRADERIERDRERRERTRLSAFTTFIGRVIGIL